MSKAPAWRDMATAPKDGTMLRLLVDFEENSTEDEEGPSVTIGFNNLEHDQQDEWRLAGWCWTHDQFTAGKGIPVGWLPLLSDERQPIQEGEPE